MRTLAVADYASRPAPGNDADACPDASVRISRESLTCPRSERCHGDDESLESLRPGDFLQRTYRDETGGTGYVDLYVAYLQNQHALFHHLPQDCLEGSGWSPVESGTTTLAFPGEAPFPANRYLIAKGDDRQLVLFWYSARGRRVASEDWMNVYLAFDSLRWNRTDNALIRMSTELQTGEKPVDAERRLLSFAGLVSPLLKNYIPL